MSSVGRTECIAYIVICQVSQLFTKLLSVLGLLCAAETGILKQNNITVFHSLNCLCSCLTGYIVICYKYYILTQLLGQAYCNRSQGLTLVRAILHFAQMGTENDFCTFTDQLLNGRQCSHDTGLIGDDAVF